MVKLCVAHYEVVYFAYPFTAQKWRDDHLSHIKSAPICPTCVYQHRFTSGELYEGGLSLTDIEESYPQFVICVSLIVV